MDSLNLLADFLDESQLADELRKCKRSLIRWRSLGEGPPFLKVGRQIYYRRTAVADWLKSLERDPAA